MRNFRILVTEPTLGDHVLRNCIELVGHGWWLVAEQLPHPVRHCEVTGIPNAQREAHNDQGDVRFHRSFPRFHGGAPRFDREDVVHLGVFLSR